MASPTNNFTSFTITQAFLGAPLQFTPALGSQELTRLIDAYVPGNASKPDKLSEVTIDFYNNATVDINTGALVRRYDVRFDQSPTQSQSSGFSPASSVTFADSGYGSISMTPPSRNRGGRVSKPAKAAKKDTKKVAEARLPGFSIMTKDGIDVTSSAGRGTKTKEQREHAHLMRIMKACEDCKRKKVRCDPSHRRQSNEMSRSSTASSSRINPSPPAPSLSQPSSFASQSTTPNETFSNAIDDFVLFPEDAASWNPANSSVADADLSNFNFDINDLDVPMNNEFDFSAFNDMQPIDFSQLYEPPMPQYGMDQWANLPVSHSRPHPSASQDLGQLDMSIQDSWFQELPDLVSHSRPHQSTLTQDSGQSSLFSTVNVSPQSIENPADEIWPDGLRREGSSPQFNGRMQRPLSEGTPSDMRTSVSLQQSVSEISPADVDVSQSSSENSPSSASQFSPTGWSGSGSNTSSRTSLQTDDVLYWTESTNKTRRGRESPAAALARRQLNSSSGGMSSSDGQEGTTDIRWRGRYLAEWQHPEGAAEQPSPTVPRENHQARPSRSTLGVSNDIFGLANTCTLVSESLRAVKEGPAECLSLAGNLQRLRTALVQYHAEVRNAGTSDSAAAGVARDTATQIHAFGQQLQGLSACIRQSQVQSSPIPQGVLYQSQVQAQTLLRSLCATINSLHTSSNDYPRPGTSNYQPLTSGRNLQLFVPASEGHDRDRHTQALSASGVESMYDGHLIAQDSRSTPPRPDYFATRLQEDDNRYALAFQKNVQEGAFAPGTGSVVPAWEVHDSPWNPVLAKEVLSSLDLPVIQTESRQQARQILASRVRLDTNSLDEMERRQQALAHRTTPDLVQLTDPTENGKPAATRDASLQEVRCSRYESGLSEGRDTYSRGSIPRAALELQTYANTVEHIPALGNALQYSKVVALAALASVIVATITRNASILALFIPFSALLLSTPGQFQMEAPICVAIMAFMGSGLFNTFQDSFQVWNGSNALVSISRFAFCAAMVAQPPSVLACAKAVATMFSLLGATNECGVGIEVDSVNSRHSLSENPRRMVNTENRRPQWLGMMDRLTAVGA